MWLQRASESDGLHQFALSLPVQSAARGGGKLTAAFLRRFNHATVLLPMAQGCSMLIDPAAES